jgi:hypothetical protein
MDTSVVHPTAPTWLKRGSASKPLAAANTRALEKHTRYDPTAAEQDADFLACIAETYGGLNEEMTALAKRIAGCAAREGCPWSVREAYSELIAAIAVNIQRGNARIVQKMRVHNKAAGLIARDLNRAPSPGLETGRFFAASKPQRAQSTTRLSAPAQRNGTSAAPLVPEQGSAPRVTVTVHEFDGLFFDEADNDAAAVADYEAYELGFDSFAGASAEMAELESYMLDEAADDEDLDGVPSFPPEDLHAQLSLHAPAQRAREIIDVTDD